MNDIRLAFRQLTKDAGFTAIATFTLALGVGATTAIFAVLDSVALDPLPYPEPERQVWLESAVPGWRRGGTSGLSQAGYFYFGEHNRTLESLGAYVTRDVSFATGQGAIFVESAVVTASMLDVLRARAAIGRLIAPADDRPGAPNVIVLGHDFWQRQYGANSDVVGSTVRIEGMTFEIVGIMAPGTRLPDDSVDVWIPLQLDPLASPANSHFLQAIGRLAPGVTVADAQRDFEHLTAELGQAFPGVYTAAFIRDTRFATHVRPLRDHVIGGIAGTLWIVLGAVGVVLVIACANLANLFLVRLESRKRELAIRSVLGAGRGAILRQGLAEGIVLGVTAGALGSLLAQAGLELLRLLSPGGIPRLQEIALDGSAFIFIAAISLACGGVLGLLLLLYAKIDATALRASRGSTEAGARNRMRSALVVGQVALALVLLASAGLLMRSFEQLSDVAPGLDPENVFTVQLSLPMADYEEYGEVQRFYRELTERVGALPGVQSAGAASGLPLQGIGICATLIVRHGAPVQGGPGECPFYAYVTPGFFETMGIPVDGAAADWTRVENRTAGVIVTRELSERLWPDGDALGGGIRGHSRNEPYYPVTGVTGNLYNTGLDEPPVEAAFLPMLPIDGAPLWGPPRTMTLVLKTAAAETTGLATAIRRIVADIDPTVPLGGLRAMDDIVADSMARRTFTMLLLGVAAGLGLFLSAVGLYGVIAYVTARRTGEIGIRMALGAARGRVAGLVVRQSFALVAAGVVLSLLTALASTRALRALLFEVSPTDPVTLLAVTLVLVIVALLASGFPHTGRLASIRPKHCGPNEAVRTTLIRQRGIECKR